MKKSFIFFLLSLSCSLLWAQHELLLYGQGGLFSLNYDLKDGTHKQDIGGGIGLGYVYNFTSHWSLGTGVEANIYRSNCTLPAMKGSYTFNEGYEMFNFRYEALDYKEQQQLYALNIPLMLTYGLPIGQNLSFYFSGGLKFGIPLWAKYSSSGTFTTKGYYYYENQEYEDIPEFELRHQSVQVDDSFSLGLSYQLSMELGLKVRVIYIGLYCDYGLNNIQKTITPVMQYTMNPVTVKYNSILNSDQVSKISSIAAGIRLKFSFL
ncbi:MAG: outer membrane beta-barrel protein [Bacteroidales bacterium]|nr:outer membrane beta-barrel protein [Bacteroidales bacterium]